MDRLHPGKRRASRVRNLQAARRRRYLALMIAGALAAGNTPAWGESAGLPSGGDVVAGQAVISAAGNMMNVDAATARSIVNWDSFDVGAGNAANFNLPDANSAILNRVTGADMPSTIAGAVNSNGHVYLVNPSGVVVSQSGMINTNGFTASTFDVGNAEFMAGGAMQFNDSGSDASIVNEGTIRTGEGGAHLIANQIANQGTISSSGGNITLSGGGTVTLDNGVTYVQPSMETLTKGISPTAGLIQNSGTIRATGAATSGGEVYLVNPNGKIMHDGTIAAQDIAASGNSTGSHVQLEADEITLTENASIDATGSHGGGDVLVGGDWKGSGPMHQATTVTMEAGAVIDASATESGDGGKIVLWSDLLNVDAITEVFGTLLARGGELFGSGGQIETSGSTVITDGIEVDAGASNGVGGLWLIDPYDYVIDASAASNIVSALNTGTSVTVSTTANNASFGSSGNNTDNGDIMVNSDIVTGAMSGDATLRLEAARHISIAGTTGIDATQNGNTARLNVELLADTDHSGDGINMVTAQGIRTNGGDLSFGDGTTASIGGINVQVGGDLYVTGSVAQTFETGGGSITVNGETIVANSSGAGLTFNSGGGDIHFRGVLDSGNQYTYVDGPDGQANSWDWARTNARNGTPGGSNIGDSYLVTITSRLENAIAGLAADYRGAWIGAYRSNPAGSYNWQWADGPEGGQTFFVQAGSGAGGGGGTAQPSWYSNFGSGEPNGALNANGESRGQFFGNQGLWNDLGATEAFSGTQTSQYSVLGYVRETNLAPSAVTVNAGAGAVTIEGGVGNGKALSSLNVTSSQTMVNGDALVTTGTQNYSSALTVTSPIQLTIDGTTVTTGGALDLTAAGNMTLDASLVATGNVDVTAATITLNDGLTSNGNGDILFRATGSTASDIVLNSGSSITKSAGSGTLTLQSAGRVFNQGTIQATGGGQLNVIMWSDYDNDNDDGGVSQQGTISTNGGHIWLGGSSSNGGSTTWNGLTVGDGPSIGTSGANFNALDLYGNVTTGGGDFLAWAGTGNTAGGGASGIVTDTDAMILDTGAGDVTLIADQIVGPAANSVTLRSTGHLTIAPDAGDFGGTLEWVHNDNPATLNLGGSALNYLLIENSDQLTGLTLGSYDGMPGVSISNTSPVTITSSIDVAGPVTATGSALTLNADLSTTANLGPGVSLSGTSILQNAGVDVSTAGADIAYTASGFLATSGLDELISLAGDAGGAGTATVNAAGGDITLDASFAAGGVAGNIDRPILLDDAVLQTLGTGAISVIGDMTFNPTTGSAYGIEFRGTNTIQTADGAILLDGTGGFAGANSRGIVIDGHTASILSETGAIRFIDRSPAGLTGSYNGFYLEPGSPGAIVIGADGSTVPSSSSDITIQANRATFDARSSQFNTNGAFVLEPLGTSFSGAINTTHLALQSGVGSVRVGVPTNTANVTLGQAINSAGDLSIYGGAVDINDTLDAAGDIVLQANTTDLEVGGSLTQNATGTSTATLRAQRHVNLESAASVAATGGAMNMQLWADTDADGDGIVFVESAGISTGGGSLTFGQSGQTTTIGGESVLVGGDVFFQRGSAQSLNTGGGDFELFGETIISNTSGLSLNTGGGSAHFHGLLDSGNAYEFVDRTGSGGSGSWNAARTDAINGTGGGSAVGDSYLMNITSRLENAIGGLVADYQGAWIGAHRPDPAGSYDWQWADGPEAGQRFFTQSGSGFGGGGSVQTGWYANFGSGEPNGALDANGENAGQFFGSEGLWNDLRKSNTYSATQATQYSVLGFVRETNLAPSSLSIDTGSGSLTVDGGIGTRKSFSTIDVTSSGTIINGAGTASTGLQNYSSSLTINGGVNPVELTATTINLGGALTVNGGDITIGADLISDATTGTGITLNGTSVLQETGVEVTTNGADISYTGQNKLATDGSDHAINLAGDQSGAGRVRIDAGGGDISLIGNFAAGGVDGSSPDRAISVNDADLVTSGTGTISLTGDATLNPNTTPTAWGMQLSNSTLVTDSGDITVVGTGGSASGNSRGIVVDHRALSVLSASGAITLTDTRPSGLTGNYNGFYLRPNSAGDIVFGADGSTVASSSSDINFQLDRATFDAIATHINTSGTFTIQPTAGNSFTAPLNTGLLNLSNDLSGLTIGHADNTANITIGAAKNVAGDISIFGGTLALNHALTASDGAPTPTLGNISLHASAGATQLAPLTGAGLALSGAGNFTLDHSGNSLQSIAAGNNTTPIGDLSLTNADALTVGGIYPDGITSSGNILVETSSSNLTVEQSVSTSSIAADAIILNAGRNAGAGTAAGGNIIVSGSPTVSTGSGGRATLFTGGVSGSTGLADLIGSGSGRFRYNSDETATNYSLALGTGLFGIYRQQPTVDVTVDNQTMTYGDSLPTWTYTLNNNVNGDSTSQIFASPEVTVTGTTSTSGNFTATDHSTSATGMGTSQLGYAVGTLTDGTLTVNQRQITTPLVIDDKVYDGTTSATFSATANNAVAGDLIDIGGTATFVDKNAGTGKTVNVSGLNLSGVDAGNYSLANTSDTSTADITPRTITVTGLAADSKVYDGTTAATIDHSGVTFNGMISGDELTASGTTGAFDNKHVGNGKTVTLSGTSYGGADLLNYDIVNQATTTGNVTPRSVTVSGLVADNRVYDGTTAATVDHGGASFDGILAGDELTVSGTVGTFADKNVETAKPVNLSGSVYGGADVGNYTFTEQTTSTADITPRSVTISGLSAVTKVYDGTTDAVVDSSGVTFNGMIGGDDLTISDTVGTFTDKNVGTNKVVNLSGSNYAGADLGNYTFTDQSTTTGDITARSVTVSGLAGVERVYDGTTAVEIDHSSVVFSGMVTGDDLTASSTTGTLADRHVGTNKVATLAGTTYGGADVGNYTFLAQPTATATITPRSLVVNLQGQGSKVYDGTSSISLGGISPTLSGIIGGDDVSVAAGNVTGYVNENAGSNKEVVYSGFGLTGADIGNYFLQSGSAPSTASITPRSVVVSGLRADSRVYDGTTVTTVDQSGVTFAGMVSGDELTASGTTGTFANKNVGTNKSVTLSGTAYGGADVGNYSITDQTTSTADITPRSLVINGIAANNKTYDGDTVATVDLSGIQWNGLVAGDDVSASVLGNFDDKNIGSNKNVQLVITEAGADIDNYSITKQQNASADIYRLSSVTWVGGLTGDWSDPANWAGGAIPDLGNVANVIIPNGVTPIFDDQVSGPVGIDSLAGGNLQVDSGTLNVANDATVDDFTQNGGIFNVGGLFTFHQARLNGGSLNVTGNATGGDWTQNGGTAGFGGDLDVDNYTQTDGDTTVGGSFNFNTGTLDGGTLGVSGNASGGDWTQNGGTAGFGGDLDVDNYNQTDGDTTVGGSFSFNTGTLDGGTLGVSGNASGGDWTQNGGTAGFGGDLDVDNYNQTDGDTTVGGSFNFNTGTLDGGTLGVTEAVTGVDWTQNGGTAGFDGDLDVDNYTQTDGDTTVGGTFTFDTGTVAGGSLHANGDVIAETYNQTGGVVGIDGEIQVQQLNQEAGELAFAAISGPLADDFVTNLERSVTDTNTRYVEQGPEKRRNPRSSGLLNSLLRLATDVFERWFNDQSGLDSADLQAEVTQTAAEPNAAAQEVFIRQRNDDGLSNVN